MKYFPILGSNSQHSAQYQQGDRLSHYTYCAVIFKLQCFKIFLYNRIFMRKISTLAYVDMNI